MKGNGMEIGMKKHICWALLVLVLALPALGMASSWSYDAFYRYPDAHTGEVVTLDGWVYMVSKNSEGLYEITLTIGTSISYENLVALQCESAFTPHMGDHIQIRARYLGLNTLGYSQTMGFKGVSELELIEGEYLMNMGWGMTEKASYAGLQTGGYSSGTLTLQGEIQKAEIYNGALAVGMVDDLGNAFVLGTDPVHLPEMQVGRMVKAVNARCEGYVIDETLLGEEYLGVPAFLIQNPTIVASDGSPLLPQDTPAAAPTPQPPVPAGIFAGAKDLPDDVAEALSGLAGFAWSYDEMEDWFLLAPADNAAYYVGDEYIIPQLFYADGLLQFRLQAGTDDDDHSFEVLSGLLVLVDGTRYHMECNDWDTWNTGLISLGNTGFEMIRAIAAVKDPVKVRLYFDEGIDCTMTEEQVAGIRALWEVYEEVMGPWQDPAVFRENDRVNPITVK